MPEFVVFARQDQVQANNPSLNPLGVAQAPTTTLTFTDGIPGGGGDLILDQPGPGTDPLPDPDTLVTIEGQTYEFTVILTGTLPSNGQGTAQLTGAAAALRGREVMLIEVDIDNDPLTDPVEYFFVLGQPPATFAQMNAIGSGAIPLLGVETDLPCFCTGTDIDTPSGTRKVEALAAGDFVLTAEGAAKQIMHVCRTRVSHAALHQNPDLRPIVIPAGAMGPGMPAADLYVSPQHRLVLQDPSCELLFSTDTVLMPAKFLVGVFANVAPVTGAVDYFHILLEEHDMLISNGVPSESFQPARRTIDVMDEAARTTLETLLAVLGAEEMLTRKDRFLCLKRPEALVLLDHLARRVPQTDTRVAGPKVQVLTF